MTGRQKFLLSMAYKYVPQYDIKNDRDREVMTLRVWINNDEVLCITDAPSLSGTNKFQVRYCEQSHSYYGLSPRVTKLDRLIGKKFRTSNAKFAVVDAYIIEDVLKSLVFEKKEDRHPLKENLVWASCPRDVWY